MINFRFHLISLIAVFLALAVGVVMGYAVLGQPTVDGLQNRVDTVEARVDHIRNENSQLKSESNRIADALKEIGNFAVGGRLTGETMVPVAVRGVDEDKVIQIVELARRAGGSVPGIVWLEDKWRLDHSDDVANLAAIVGTANASASAVRDAATRALAARLVSGPGSSGRSDVLSALDTAGFASAEGVDGIDFDPVLYNGRGARLLIIGGTNGAIPHSKSTVPLTRVVAEGGAPVVLADEWREGDGRPERGAALAEIRNDPKYTLLVSTLDDLDAADGALAAVLVVAQRGAGTVGHYGFGDGADDLMPPWWIA